MNYFYLVILNFRMLKNYANKTIKYHFLAAAKIQPNTNTNLIYEVLFLLIPTFYLQCADYVIILRLISSYKQTSSISFLLKKIVLP